MNQGDGLVYLPESLTVSSKPPKNEDDDKENVRIAKKSPFRVWRSEINRSSSSDSIDSSGCSGSSGSIDSEKKGGDRTEDQVIVIVQKVLNQA